MMNKKITPVLVTFIMFLSSILLSQEKELEELKKIMGDFKIKIEHKSEDKKEADKPPFRRESWTFMTGVLNPKVNYNRFLNQPPDFSGKYPSLANSDTGIGFDGGAFGNWYRGNCVRIIINGRDIMAERTADVVEHKEGENGYLRFVWKLEAGGTVTLNITVPGDGTAIYARVDLAPGGLKIDSFQMRLTCYPGGFSPAYGIPSHRWVMTAKNEEDIPKDFKKEEGKDYPRIPVTADEVWIFYADKLQSSGSLGLVFLPEEKPSGQVRMSSYGQSTELNYPPDTRQVHLAFYAFGIGNEAAKKLLVDSLAEELEILRSIPFCPDKK